MIDTIDRLCYLRSLGYHVTVESTKDGWFVGVKDMPGGCYVVGAQVDLDTLVEDVFTKVFQ